MICNCKNKTCIDCDPGIEAFYQQKVRKAKEAEVALKAQGIIVNWEDLVGEAIDVWYEYCELKAENEAEEAYSNLLLCGQEYRDSYAADEWGDELWEAGIDPWDDEMELLAEDMQRDADIEWAMRCQAEDAEEAYWDEVYRKELKDLQEKLDNME